MANQKILVIDDSKVIRTRVKEMLPGGNIEVLEAKDGVEGLDLIRRERPNLIMLDFLLPKKSGWEVFQEIRNTHSVFRTIPLVLMSGRKEEVAEKIPEPFEEFSFVEKPFEKKELVDAIKEAMQKAKKISPPPPPESGTSPTSGGVSAAEIEALNAKIANMQAEIDALKKQLAQLVTFIKQKLK